MDIEHKNGILILGGGFLKPTYQIPIAQTKYWKFVAEENGATYYTFNLGGSNQHVSISSDSPESLKKEIQQIQRIIGTEPVMEISQSRFPTGEILLAADISLGILGLVFLTMDAS